MRVERIIVVATTKRGGPPGKIVFIGEEADLMNPGKMKKREIIVEVEADKAQAVVHDGFPAMHVPCSPFVVEETIGGVSMSRLTH